MLHRPKKSLGQNFLQDDNVAHKIVRLFNPVEGDCVVEIGPGKGALTALLLNSLSHITAIELDDDLAPLLQEQFGEKITIIHQSILDVSLPDLQTHHGKPIRLIGNIPYNITTPILFHVVDSLPATKDFMVMMQTEVAQRIVAKPRTKEYGILSVLLQYYSTPRIQFAVSKNSFFPIPNVSSAILHLDFEKPFAHRAKNDQLFRKIVRGTFGTRRKTLRNGLKGIHVPMTEFEKLSVDLELRPEELTVADFVKLSDELIEFAPQILNIQTEESDD
ncbi:MAG: 16S rRNA (adenine(1518)-N(6)/adenine(1519)-N(6))-dimethyltransferase RsmA [Bacteroidota bacterium]|nr:16S rRNA (adenine(1518)-N(6)/adenine(1519)-N(6))-dimethyltransferase RsmA [Bacteroidota bacterium]